MRETWKQTTVNEAVTGSTFPIERNNLCRKSLQLIDELEHISAYTSSKTCAFSDETLRDAYFRIKAGGVRVMLAGGCEKVSNSPYTLYFMKKNVRVAIRNKLPRFSEIADAVQENDMVYINEM